jgi:hypothetical protein
MATSFADLKFEPHSVAEGGVQAQLELGKFELSVVDMKGNGPLYEVAIFANGNFVQLPDIHPNYGEEGSDDVIHYQTADKITEIIKKIHQINLDFVEIFGQPEMDFR